MFVITLIIYVVTCYLGQQNIITIYVRCKRTFVKAVIVKTEFYCIEMRVKSLRDALTLVEPKGNTMIFDIKGRTFINDVTI
jgi:hypothetical protein